MNYLSAWLLSFGLGTGSLHTDFNKFHMSGPGLSSEISLISCFGYQYVGAKIGYQSNTIQMSDWAVQSGKINGESFRVNNFKASFFLGGELQSIKHIGRFSVFAGLSFIDEVGLGLNGSFIWKIPNHKKQADYFYYCKIEANYWGSDLMDGYRDSLNQFGDLDVSFIVGIQVPIYLTNNKN